MYDTRNIKLKVGDTILVIDSVNGRTREGVISHFADAGNGETVAHFFNRETGRLNKAWKYQTFKVPQRP